MENLQILNRGLWRKCPQCGRGRLFEGWIQVRDDCPVCRLPLAAREGDTWAFMYISTAFITGLFVLMMLWVLPKNLWMGRLVIAVTALAFFFLTWPFRKGVAIALDYLIELRFEKKEGLNFQPDRPNSSKQ